MSDPVTEHLNRLRLGGFATDLRIPLVDSIYPGQAYVICVAINDSAWGGIMPTENELLLLHRYLEYLYTSPWVRPSPSRPFDIDPGRNTIVFLKRAEGDWAYHKSSWHNPPNGCPIVWPSLSWDQRYDLGQLLDKIEHDSLEWNQFQEEHRMP